MRPSSTLKVCKKYFLHTRMVEPPILGKHYTLLLLFIHLLLSRGRLFFIGTLCIFIHKDMHFVLQRILFSKNYTVILSDFFINFTYTFSLAFTVFVFKLFHRNYIIVSVYVFYTRITKSVCNIPSPTITISYSFLIFSLC